MSQFQKTKYGYQAVRKREINQKTGIDTNTLLYIKQINNKDKQITNSTRNSIQ